MKNKIILIAVLLTGMLASCKKEDQTPSKTVKVHYPVITLNGDAVVALPVGGSYTDLGAVATDSIEGYTRNLTTSDVISTDEPGFYSVTYSDINKEGFETKVQRFVLVSSASASFDLSGKYQRVQNGVEVNVTKVAPGLFKIDNVGGVANPSDAIFDAFIGLTTDSTIDLPPQTLVNEYYVEPVSFEDIELDLSGGDTVMNWVINSASVFGTSSRTFQKIP